MKPASWIRIQTIIGLAFHVPSVQECGSGSSSKKFSKEKKTDPHPGAGKLIKIDK
jgi:hypothetical protein